MKNSLIIEPFTTQSLNKICDVLEIEFDNFWNYNILKSELENTSSIYLCCKQDDEIIGFAGISIVLDTAELNNIVIRKNKRGQGYSSFLLKMLIKSAKSHGCNKINLEVSSKNIIAIKLYTNFGFKQVGLRPGYYRGVDALLFTLDI